MSITAEQREQIMELLRLGETNSKRIARKVGCRPMAVAAVKAHLTRGSYNSSERGEDPAVLEKIVDAVESPEVAEAYNEEAEERQARQIEFLRESDLQRWVREDLVDLEDGLVPIDGGRELVLDECRFDIVARDSRGSVVVIELKRGTVDDRAVAQIARYVGKYRSKFPNQPVRGLLIAENFDDAARLAASEIPSINLIQYRAKLTFSKGSA